MTRYPWTEPDGSFTRLYNWPFASQCHSGCPYCFAHKSYRAQVAAGARWWTDAQAVAAWKAVRQRYGEGLILFAGLECTLELPLVGAVLEHHRGIIQIGSNCEPDEIKRHVPPARVSINPTFHPHLWGMEIDGFLEWVRILREAGYVFGCVAMIGWPPYLKRFPEWAARLRAENLVPNVAPCRSCNYQGRPLPESYSQEDLAILSGLVPVIYDQQGKFRPLKITACGAGMATVCVMLDGSVWRCAQVSGMGGQNLFRDGNLQLADAPQPCEETSCRCGHLHKYHVRLAERPPEEPC